MIETKTDVVSPFTRAMEVRELHIAELIAYMHRGALGDASYISQIITPRRQNPRRVPGNLKDLQERVARAFLGNEVFSTLLEQCGSEFFREKQDMAVSRSHILDTMLARVTTSERDRKLTRRIQQIFNTDHPNPAFTRLRFTDELDQALAKEFPDIAALDIDDLREKAWLGQGYGEKSKSRREKWLWESVDAIAKRRGARDGWLEVSSPEPLRKQVLRKIGKAVPGCQFF